MSDDLPMVSDHAVLRWLERVHGLGPRIERHFKVPMGDARKARYGCHLLEITIDEAREMILPSRLRFGVQAGASRIIAHDRVLVCDGRRVVTCLAHDTYRRGKPINVEAEG